MGAVVHHLRDHPRGGGHRGSRSSESAGTASRGAGGGNAWAAADGLVKRGPVSEQPAVVEAARPRRTSPAGVTTHQPSAVRASRALTSSSP